MEKFFQIKERNSTIRTEIMGGLTTFFAMAYIVFVNPAQVAAGGAGGWLVELGADPVKIGAIWNSTYIASIIVAIIGTMLMAVYAKMPFAQACGMGLNSFFCTTFVAGAFFNGLDVVEGYQAGLVIILLSGIIFLVLSVTGLRSYIARGLPDCLKKAIPAGIGLFIAFIGFQNVGIVQANQYTLVQFVDINGAIDGGTFMATALPAIIALLGLLIIAILGKFNVKGNVIIGILATSVIYYLVTWTVPSFELSQIGQSFKDFANVGVTGVFKAASWTNAFTGANIGGVFNAIVLVLSFCLVDMFDTIGTLFGAASEANMLDKNGDPINVDKCMLADSIGTCAGAILGTSTCTTFVESSAGVAAGARTGLASVVTSACFFVCLFLSPLASIIPSAATASALIYVGVLMLRNFSKVDMNDIASAVPAFLTLIMMPMAYSISTGIGLGCISYTVITLVTGKFKSKDIVVAAISVLFILKFLFITM